MISQKNETTKPQAEFNDFQSWVIAAYPEVKASVDGVPDSILEEMYPEVSNFGPAAKEIEDLYETVFRVAKQGGSLNLRLLFNRIREEILSGDMVVYLSVYAHWLSDQQRKAHKELMANQPKECQGFSDHIKCISMAYTVLAFREAKRDGPFTPGAVTVAKKVVNSWTEIKAHL